MVEKRVAICRGFSMPFFPMRPRPGASLKTERDIVELDYTRYCWSLKLNGDRACLAVRDGKLYLQNRLGSWLKQSVELHSGYSKLKGTWLLDGEVYRKQFYPFEVIVERGRSLAQETTIARSLAAEKLTYTLELPWLYGRSNHLSLLQFAFTSADRYEGVVGKSILARYVPLGSVSSNSPTWVKRKWV